MHQQNLRSGSTSSSLMLPCQAARARLPLKQHRSYAAAAVCAREPAEASWQGSQQLPPLGSSTAAGSGDGRQPWLGGEQQLQLPKHQRLQQQLAQMQELQLGLMHSLHQFDDRQQQQQQQPPALPVRARAYDAAAAALSTQLKSAGSWQQALQLVQVYAQAAAQQQQPQTLVDAMKQLNPQHLSCFLSTLARLQPPPPAAAAASAAATRRATPHKHQQQQEAEQFTQLVQSAFSEVLQQLPALQPREASSILWAACKLQQPPAAAQLKQLLAAMAQPALLAAANAQDVSMALYAAAVLGLQVPEQQLEALLAAAAAAMPGAAPQALANTLWAVATVQYRPSEAWLAPLEERCCGLLQQQQQQQASQQQRNSGASFGTFSCKGLHQLLWSMAKLQWIPEQRFLELFWAASAAQLPHMTPHGTAGILWAAASLELTPPGPWLHAWLAALLQQLLQRRCNDQDVSNALWALVKLGVRPHDEWLAAAMDGSGAVLAGAGSQELSLLLWSWAKLGVRPQQQWMAAWLAAMGQRMGSYCAPALASSAYALALLRFRPPRAWCEQLVGESQRQMAAFGAQELACLAWALAVLRLRPDRAWLDDFQSQALSESGSFNGQELSLICWALARLGHRPPVAWLAALLHDGLELQGGLAGQSLVLLVQALARWDLPQLKEGGKYRVLLPRYWAASQQLLPRCSLYQLSVLWWARARLGCVPGSAWGEAFWQAATPALAAALHAAPGVLYGATCAAAELNMHSPQQALGAAEQQQQLAPAGERAARDAPPLSPAIVVQLIWATGKMSRQVPAATFDLMLQAAQRVVPQCSFEGLTAMGLGLARMRRVAAAAAAAGRRAAATSAQGQQQGGDCAAATCQQAALWEPWFARSLQLLQQDPKVAAQMRLQQQHSQDRADARSGGSTASPVHPQDAAEQQQQQQQQRVSIHSADISLQLYIAAHFQLAPPAAWSRAMLAATSVQLQGMSLEQLSWVVWAVARLRLGPQLPPGWLAAVLVRVSHVPVRPSSAAAAAMSRLGKSMWRLSSAECVQPQERQLWLLTARRWSTAQGIV